MTQPKQPAIAIIGGNSSINYLFERYTERLGYSVMVVSASASVETICGLQPVAVIFPSVENLENSQPLAAELANFDIPIIVCSSMADQARTRELGADYCLLHPLVYDNFFVTLTTIATSQSIRYSGNVGQGPDC